MNPECARCGSQEGVQFEDSGTAYVTPPCGRYERLCLDDPLNGDPPDPNAPIPLCRPCAKDHHDYWDAMWEEYNLSRL